jgi:hypothetical protein
MGWKQSRSKARVFASPFVKQARRGQPKDTGKTTGSWTLQRIKEYAGIQTLVFMILARCRLSSSHKQPTRKKIPSQTQRADPEVTKLNTPVAHGLTIITTKSQVAEPKMTRTGPVQRFARNLCYLSIF